MHGRVLWVVVAMALTTVALGVLTVGQGLSGVCCSSNFEHLKSCHRDMYNLDKASPLSGGISLSAEAAYRFDTRTERPRILVTFPHYHIVLREAFPHAEVRLLVPPGIDPHHYQLTSADLQLLMGLGPGDLIVNSMHVRFELEIAKRAARGEIKAMHLDVTTFNKYLTWDGKVVTLKPHEEDDEDH
ncbi:MAG: hypothetical protein QW049_02480, partial [Pyrobaculum sp.]